MSERYGYWNRILHVNLTDRSHWVEEPGDEFYKRYGGGRGFIAHYLLKYTPAGVDAFDPRNTLVFAPGVLTGAPVPGAGRHSVGAKSPLTGGFGEAEAGGFWGAEVKRAKWDAIVCHGASETPVYLWLTEQGVEIRDASHLWGQPALEVEEAIKTDHGDKLIRVAQCGIAGENLVRFAIVGNDLNEAAGRTGLGAVMGSKKLKAIAVRGTNNVPIADKATLQKHAKWVASTVDTVHRGFHEYGTGAAMQGKDLEGGMPTRNYRDGSFEEISLVDAIAVGEGPRIAMEACFACSVRCKKVVQIEQRQEDAGVTKKGKPIMVDPLGRWRVDPRYGGPEYESLAALGPSLGVGDIVSVLKSNETCNALGLDTISAGATLAWAMECFEKEVLTPSDTGGVSLRFGDGTSVPKLLEMIAYREGFGDTLAEGSLRAAQKTGRGSDGFLTTVKGMELAMHDPRHMEMMRVSYLLAPTGGDHMRQTSEKNGMRNQVGMCHFLQYDDPMSLEILNSVTGWGFSQDDIFALGQRGLTLARLFNLREGFSSADDHLPERFMEDLPKHKGVSEDQQHDIVQAYYTSQGWDQNGVPTPEKIAALGLQEDYERTAVPV